MDELLAKLPFWQSLTEDEKALISESAYIKKYEAGSQLHDSCSEGDSCLGVLYIASGEARVYIMSDEGREITLFRIRTGESCVLSASCAISQISFETIMTVEVDSEILIVPTHVFARLIRENIYARCWMYELTAERFSDVMWVMQQILFERFDSRLAGFLLSEYERKGSAHIYMTQEEIAKDVNSAREVVARMLKQFAMEELIDYHRGKITLKDVEGLRRLV